jgi:NarL family two-component system response regulator YdfI
MAGETVLPDSVSSEVIEDRAKDNKPLLLNRLNELTPREIAVLKFAARGMTNKDIAIRLGLSVRSVKANFTNLYLKLGVASRTEAVSMALKVGTITLDDLNE